MTQSCPTEPLVQDLASESTTTSSSSSSSSIDFFEDPFLLEFPFDQCFTFSEEEKISVPRYFCGFKVCKHHVPFKDRTSVLRHYRRFHKQDIVELTMQNQRPPAVLIQGPTEPVLKSSMRQIPSVVVPTVVDAQEKLYELENPLPLRKRSRSSRKGNSSAKKMKADIDHDHDHDHHDHDHYDDSENDESTAADTLKTLETDNHDEESMKMETIPSKQAHESSCCNHPHHHHNHQNQNQPDVLKQIQMQSDLKVLLASASMIVRLQSDAIQRRANINNFVVAPHPWLGMTSEKLAPQTFLESTSHLLKDYLHPYLQSTESKIHSLEQEIDHQKNDFLKEFESFSSTEMEMLQIAKNANENEIRRSYLFSKLLMNQMDLSLKEKDVEYIGGQVVKEILEERLSQHQQKL